MTALSKSPTGDHWLEMPSGKFALYVDGVQRALADTTTNNAMLIGQRDVRSERLVVPESKVVFNAVEERLGIKPVRQFRSEFAQTTIDWRAMAERRADAFKKAHPNEPQHHIKQAWALLNSKSEWGLSTKGSEARSHLGQALTALEKNGGRWTLEIRQRADAALSCLREAPVRSDSMFEPQAKHHCEKALASLSQTQKPDLQLDQTEAKKWRGPRQGRGRSL